MLAPQNAPSPTIPYHQLLRHLQYAYNTVLSSIQEFPTFHILSYIQLEYTDEKNPSPRRLINVDPPSATWARLLVAAETPPSFDSRVGEVMFKTQGR